MVNTCNMFDPMPTTYNEASRLFMENIIFESGVCGGGGIPFDPDKTESQDGRAPFMVDHEGMGNTFGEDNGGTTEPLHGGPTWHGKAFRALEAFKAQRVGNSVNLTHCWMVINGDEIFKAQYATIRARGGKAAIEEHGEGEKSRPRGNTNSKKEDKREAATLALQDTLQGMITNKDSREEKRRQDKDEQIKASWRSKRRSSCWRLESRKDARD
ncbi:C2 domain-containing protein [Hordeum vulgare]|nr:C2 domain-containing protein [Hordeum vulgare]